MVGANAAVYTAAGVPKNVCTSPHCRLTFEREFSEFDAPFQPVQQTQLFAELMASSATAPAPSVGQAESMMSRAQCFRSPQSSRSRTSASC